MTKTRKLTGNQDRIAAADAFRRRLTKIHLRLLEGLELHLSGDTAGLIDRCSYRTVHGKDGELILRKENTLLSKQLRAVLDFYVVLRSEDAKGQR